MTHPINNPSPGGPGRLVAPLTVEQRACNYRQQLGHNKLTARQRRRMTHKANRAQRHGSDMRFQDDRPPRDDERPRPLAPPPK